MAEKTDAIRVLNQGGAAPADERYDAQMVLEKAHRPGSADLLDQPTLVSLVEHTKAQARMAYQLQAELESSGQMMKSNVIQLPTQFRTRRGTGDGMRSVWLNEFQVQINGDWYEKTGSMGFDTMRAMVERTPILNAIVLTRMRQAQKFCRRPPKPDMPGFEIATKDPGAKLTPADKMSIEALSTFISNCGWEEDPRRRKLLKRDTFDRFMMKQVRDSLTMDSAPIETEFKRNRSLGIDGFYAIDGATIRLCTERGYEGDDAIFALQVIDGMPRTAYTLYDLIYEARNPRTEVNLAGYGLSETELLVRVVTGFINAMELNLTGFSDNSIPKGVLNLIGDYDTDQINAFKTYLINMVRGVKNAFAMPVLVGKDSTTTAKFEKFGADFDEMYFSKWMTFLTSIACAIYSIGPDEINFESFRSGGGGGMRGNDTEEKITASKDKGFTPLMSNFEQLISQYIVGAFGGKFVFRWTGLNPEDQEKRHEMRKATLTVNEIRAQEGYEPVKENWGSAPINPALVSVWQAGQQMGGGGLPTGPDGKPKPNGRDDPRDPDDDPDPTRDPHPEPPPGSGDSDPDAPDMRKAFPNLFKPGWST